MTKKSDAPAIRFKGFSDAWEQRKFSDITFPAGEKNKDNLPLESYSITNEHGFVPQDEKFENGGAMREADKRMYYIVSPNSFAYNPARINVGSIGYQNVGKNVIVSSLYEVFKTSEDVDDRLLWHWFKSPDFQKLIMQLQEGGVRLYFYYDKLCMGEVSLPSLEEQRKIGKLFDTLDNLITLHQRKFEKLTNVKKSMLEKMFPQNGSSYPEIRFKGFTDPWEQRELSEIADKVTEKNTGLQYVETFTNSAEFGIISQRDFFDHDIAKLGSLDGYYIVKNEDFVYNPRISTSAPVGPINRNKLGRTGVMSPLYTVFRPHDIDTTYLEYFFKCDYWHSFMNFNGDSGARSDRFSIKDNVFFQMPIPIPDIDEQRKIGELLTCLDNLITLHQRKFEKLTNVKKSMLEKMFPQNGSSYPEIRFKGFTDPWEQRKLGDVVKEITRNDPESEAPIMMITANNGFIEQSERYAFNNAGESLKKYILLKKGELAYNHGASKLRPYGSCFALTTAENARIPFVYHCFSAENQNAEFMSIELNGAEIENQLRKIVSSGARMDGLLNISFDEYTSVSVLLPGTEEQDRIADFFRHLDNLITLHQRELEKLQNIKKSMLEKMFV